MSEIWRIPFARWSRPVFQLALLASGRRTTAEGLLLKAYRRVCTDPMPANVELALYSALARDLPRFSFPMWRGVVSSGLRRYAPSDRLLLGLWLLRGLRGPELVAATGLSSQSVVERLAVVLEHDAQPDPTLKLWLAEQLQLPGVPDGHNGPVPRAGAARWQERVAQLRALLEAAVESQGPSADFAATFEAQMGAAGQPAGDRRVPRRLLQLALVVATLILCAGLIVPRRAPAETERSAATPRALVEATLRTWTRPDTPTVLHQQVRAVDPMQAPATPLVTDIWLAGGGKARHRVEVRQGSGLVEWQIGDGDQSLSYGARPGWGACPWRLEKRDTPASRVLSFALPPDEQLRVRDAQLTQGAYGTGYRALNDALAAHDLRSFGTRRDGETSVIILGYTERAAPKRQVTLSIDPARSQLHSVQAVSSEHGQTTTVELWRLLLYDEAAGDVPMDLPRRNERVFATLVDAACPLLQPPDLRSLHSMVGIPWQEWYLPSRLPPSITRAAIVESAPYLEAEVGSEAFIGASAQFIGPGRWLGLSAGKWLPNAGGVDDVQRGQWRVALREESRPGTWHGNLRRTRERFAPPFVVTVNLSAVGWTQDELLQFIDSLAMFDIERWRDLDQHFVDPRPLSAEAQGLLRLSMAALQVPPDHAVFTAARATFRTAPRRPLDDPYHEPHLLRTPEALSIAQWQVLSGTHVVHFSETLYVPDGRLYQATLNHGERSVFDNRAEGWIGIDAPAGQDGHGGREQPGTEMLSALLVGAEALEVRRDGDDWVLEQAARDTRPGIGYEFSGRELPIPFTEDLPAGDVVRRLWLDAGTYLPRRFEIAHRDERGLETPLFGTEAVERRVVARSDADTLALPAPPPDVLLFSSTALHWRRARAAFPPLSSDWLESSFDRPAALLQAGERIPRASVEQALAWTETAGPALLWRLLPATSLSRLHLSTTQANTWYGIGSLPFAHRAQYRMPENGAVVTLTQAPAALLGHILRYPPRQHNGSIPTWTTSRPVVVTIAGEAREAWLLQDAGFAVLVCEIDGTLLHISGQAEYLQRDLLQHLPRLVWTPARGD